MALILQYGKELVGGDIIDALRESIQRKDYEKLKQTMSVIPFFRLDKDLTGKIVKILIDASRDKEDINIISDLLLENIEIVPRAFPSNKYIETLASRYISQKQVYLAWSPALIPNDDGTYDDTNFSNVLISLLHHDDERYETLYLITKLENIRKTYYPNYTFKSPYKYIFEHINFFDTHNSSTNTIQYVIGGYRKFSKSKKIPDWIEIGNYKNTIQRYGPDNPTFDGNSHHMLFGDDWFFGYCDYCNRKIVRKEYSLRKPIFGGGWKDTYCSWLHVLLSQGNLNDPFVNGLVAHFSGELAREKIRISEK